MTSGFPREGRRVILFSEIGRSSHTEVARLLECGRPSRSTVSLDPSHISSSLSPASQPHGHCMWIRAAPYFLP